MSALGKILAVSLCAALAEHAAAATTYTVTDLGDTYVVNGSQGKVLNDKGEVIGNQLGTTGAAFLYTGGSWHSLGNLNTSGSGDTATLAHGLNNASLVVGEGDTGLANAGTDQTDGFLIAGAGGTLTALGLVSGSKTNQVAAAYGCNDLGAIVGNVIDSAAATRDTFIYVPGKGITSRVSDGIFSFAINRYGDVLGSAIGLPPKPVLNGVALPAATAGFNAHAINNAGQILLSVDDVHPLAAGWGLIYDYSAGKATALGNLNPQSAGYTSFLDINDSGAVVGRGSDASANPHAVLYTPAAGLISLDGLGLTVASVAVHLTEAHGINNAGQIVCLGYTTDATDLHTYLLTPAQPPILPLAASYDGLASVGGANVGVVAIAVSKTNIASVKLTAPGVSYAFKVTLSNGSFSNTVTIKNKTLTVVLNADAAHQNISGSIADATTTYTIAALREAKLGIFAGNYTALLQISGPANGLPQGIGYGAMKVSKTGTVTIKGQLGDGAAYSVSALLHYDGSWNFYAPLYTKSASPGAIAGSMTFDRTAAESDCAGTLKWNKPGDFTTDVTSQAALFKPVKGAQLLHFTNTTAGVATFAFSGGEQSLAAKTLAVTGANIVTVTSPSPDPDKLAVKFSSSTGAMTGSFLHPATLKKTSFAGVIQQKLNLGGGVFFGQMTEGGVLLTPQ